MLANRREATIAQAAQVEERLASVVSKMIEQGEGADQTSRDRSRVVLTTIEYLKYLHGAANRINVEGGEVNEDDLTAIPTDELEKIARTVLQFAAKRLGEGRVRELVS